MDVAAERTDVAARAPHRGGVDVRSVKLQGAGQCRQRGPDRPDPQHKSTTTGARPVPPVRARSCAACWTRNPVRRRGNTPASTSIRSPQNSAQPRMCSSGSPETPLHHGVKLVRRGGGSGQQPGLVLGEDAAGSPQPPDDPGAGRGRSCSCAPLRLWCRNPMLSKWQDGTMATPRIAAPSSLPVPTAAVPAGAGLDRLLHPGRRRPRERNRGAACRHGRNTALAGPCRRRGLAVVPRRAPRP